MTKDVSVFENENFGSLRTVEINGKIYFCGKDVAKALGYSNTRKALNDHCKSDGVTNRYPIVDSLGRKREARFIPEGDVYRLIVSSKLPTAEKFESWVFDEVLPEIRRTGSYKGRSKVRIEAAKTRLKFTDTLLIHGIAKPNEYINITKAMKEPFGLQTKKKKDMTEKEVKMIAASEWLASAMLDDEQGYTDVKPVCTEASATVASAVVNKMLRLKDN